MRRAPDTASRYVLHFHELDATQVAAAGGKGANLGELSRIEDIQVPSGFCVTTRAFAHAVASVSSRDAQLLQLSHLRSEDHDAIRALSARVRRDIEAIAVPPDVAADITRALAQLGDSHAYAV